MRVELVAVEIETADGAATRTAGGGDGSVGVGSLVVDLVVGDGELDWTVANRDDEPVAVMAVVAVWELVEAPHPIRMFRNGYQSWSPTDVATLGVDRDPSTADTLDFLRDMHHADRRQARPGDLRSEMVTVLSAGGASPLLMGFAGGDRHDGTIRLRTTDRGVELRAEAVFGGAEIAPGERRHLHAVRLDADGDVAELLTRWAAAVGSSVDGTAGAARVGAPYQVGWCSWYHYFEGVTEADIRSNLAAAGSWPFSVFQLDDGYQAAVGDWLHTNDDFPAGVDGVAAAIAGAGYDPGIWLAPFLAAPGSRLADAHPDWFARDRSDPAQPLVGMFNEIWGGFMWGLDVTLPEVQDHLAATAGALVDAGYRYLKLDFTVSAKIDGRYDDPRIHPGAAGAGRLRRGAPRRRRRHVHPRLWSAAGIGRRPGGRHAHWARRGPALAARRARRAARVRRSTAIHQGGVAIHPRPVVPAPAVVAERSGLPHVAAVRDPPVGGADPGLGPGGRSVGGHGPRLRRARPVGRRRTPSARRGGGAGSRRGCGGRGRPPAPLPGRARHHAADHPHHRRPPPGGRSRGRYRRAPACTRRLSRRMSHSPGRH